MNEIYELRDKSKNSEFKSILNELKETFSTQNLNEENKFKEFENKIKQINHKKSPKKQDQFKNFKKLLNKSNSKLPISSDECSLIKKTWVHRSTSITRSDIGKFVRPLTFNCSINFKF